MRRFLTKLDYLLRETLLGLRRGGWMNWAAISTVTVLLFLFGISLQTSWQLNGLLEQLGNQLEVSVYLQPEVRAQTIQVQISGLDGVADVQTVTKEAAWQGLLKELGNTDIQGATAQLEGNPLVDSLKVKARNPEQVSALASQIEQIQGIDEVQYANEAVQSLAHLNQGLGWLSLGVITVLTLTAIAVITTTIRLIVMARRREIEVMQLVGATVVWIYFPFILQGITFGLTGSAVAWGLIVGVQQFLVDILQQQPDLVQFFAESLALKPLQVLLLPLILIGFGTTVGIVGSLFAVRRFALR
ncbi:ABC transporter permease [Leptolyngbya sp. FACHB-261]|uniref:cell division protein FtsX n=1 Tax=Leptolyngbya sp. FACHB-261 TaxID=2692806 RepID=UPI001683948E|nr:permease-like cell division protein FtsX [Leptolyngbya sp. FACHB-261]MBD2102086.1 ABC transporter permease [Leptolyngbya sp. FACHB-261]